MGLVLVFPQASKKEATVTVKAKAKFPNAPGHRECAANALRIIDASLLIAPRLRHLTHIRNPPGRAYNSMPLVTPTPGHRNK